MSTRASVQIVDGKDVLYFYQHSDGYPEGLGKALEKALSENKVARCSGDAEYLAGCLLMEINRGYIEANEHIPSLVPAIGVHGDESYTYQIDADTLKITTHKGARAHA